MFDVFFSVSHGFDLDFPFIQLSISTPALVVGLVSLVALRVVKFVRARKVEQVSEWETSEPSVFDWEQV